MRKVLLYGELGEKFGKEYNFEINSPAEAIRALATQIEGFEKYLIESEKNGVAYKVFSDDSEIPTVKELNMFGTGDIKIVPVIVGANAEARVLVGATLIAASFLVVPFAPGASPYLMNAGIALALGGAIEMISGPNKNVDYSSGESADNRPSYNFSGAVNTTAQGHPVPVGYGRLIVGGAVISAGLSTESLKAGYRYVDVSKYVDCWSINDPNNLWPYGGVPPTNYTSKTLIQTLGQYPETWYLYRYFYTEKQLQFVAV